MNDTLIQLAWILASVVCFVVVVAAGLCAFVIHRADAREDATAKTLTHLFSITNDRCLNISDFHLRAKREEWDGRNAAPPAPRRIVSTEPVVEVEEGQGLDWTKDVSAVGDNGRA